MTNETRWAASGPAWEDQWDAWLYADWLEDQGRQAASLITRWAVHAGRWPLRCHGETYLWGGTASKWILWRLSHTLPSPIARVLCHRWRFIVESYHDSLAAAMARLLTIEAIEGLDLTYLVSAVLLPYPENLLETASLSDCLRGRLDGRPPPARHWPPAAYFDPDVSVRARCQAQPSPAGGPGG